MVDFGESDKMMKISGKMDESDTYKGFKRMKYITTKLFVSVWFIIYIYIYIYIYYKINLNRESKIFN